MQQSFRFEWTVSTLRRLRVLGCASLLALAACGGGGGGSDDGDTVDPDDADAVTEVVDVAVNDAIANKVIGSPPEPSATTETDAPVTSADVTSTSVKAGEELVVPVTIRSVSAIETLYAKIPGAESYFEVDVAEAGKRAAAVTGKVAVVRNFSLNLTVPSRVRAGQFCFELSARDVNGLVSNVARICLAVVDDAEPPSNEAPIARTSSDLTVLPGAAVTLNGNASSDADGSIASYAWTQVRGPGVTLATPNAVTTTFTAPANPTELAFVLTVTDNSGAAGSDSVAITVSTTPARTTISFETATQAALESAGTVRVGLSVVPASTTPITLPYTIGGTASASDRTIAASPLQIPAGATNVAIDIRLTDDNGAEPDETVILTLGTPSGGELGATRKFTLTIKDNEGAPPATGTLFVVDESYRLVRFQASAPGTIQSVVDITGVAANPDGLRPLVTSLDFRPATGELYLYVDNRRFYKLNTTTGAATLLASTNPQQVDAADLNGLDFNPCSDQLRAIGADVENFRFNANGAFVARDSNLAYVQGDSNAGGEAFIDGIAYSACVAGKTTLYGVDSFNNTLVRIGSPDGTPSAPDAGRMTTIGTFATGVGGASQGGFDIDRQSGAAYLTDGDGTQTTLYRIDLGTGTQTNLGIIGDGTQPFRTNCLAVQP